MAIKMKTTVKLRAKADCPSHSKSDIAIRDINFAIDEPSERGGTNLGPTPTDTAIAALIGCTNVIGHKCASKLGVDIGHLTIDAICDFDRRGVTLEEEIEVQPASEPTDIIWENRNFTEDTRNFKRIVVSIIIVILLAVSFAIIFTCQKSSLAKKMKYPKVNCKTIDVEYVDRHEAYQKDAIAEYRFNV